MRSMDALAYQLTMLPPSTLRPVLLLDNYRSASFENVHTLVKLGDEVIRDRLELCGVDGEDFLEVLDLLQQILGDICLRPYDASISSWLR